jgi:hypothetical protein
MPNLMDARAAVTEYFQGERTEMMALVVFSAASVGVSIALFAVTRDRFAKGLASVLLAMAVVFMSVAVPLLSRDTLHRQEMVQRMTALDAEPTVARENARMSDVIGRYAYYRYCYAAMLVAAAIIAVGTRSSLANGIAVGLLVFAATGLVVDHYSEERARVYRTRLASEAIAR